MSTCPRSESASARLLNRPKDHEALERATALIVGNIEAYGWVSAVPLSVETPGLMTGLALSALAPNNDRATSFIPLILIPQVIFSGIIFSLDNIGLQFLGSFFPVRWAMAAMGSTVGLHGDKLGSGGDFAYQGTLFSIYSREQAVVHLLLMWFALIVLILALGFATGYFLKRKDVRK